MLRPLQDRRTAGASTTMLSDVVACRFLASWGLCGPRTHLDRTIFTDTKLSASAELERVREDVRREAVAEPSAAIDLFVFCFI